MSFVMSNEEARLRVVLLDDDPKMRRVLVRVGAAHGVEIVGVETPEEARALLAGNADVAVLDFSLGEDETTAELARALHDAGSLVVVWTGAPDRAREALGEDIPVIAKSADPRELFGTLLRLVRKRAAKLAAFAQLWAGEGA